MDVVDRLREIQTFHALGVVGITDVVEEAIAEIQRLRSEAESRDKLVHEMMCGYTLIGSNVYHQTTIVSFPWDEFSNWMKNERARAGVKPGFVWTASRLWGEPEREAEAKV